MAPHVSGVEERRRKGICVCVWDKEKQIVHTIGLGNHSPTVTRTPCAKWAAAQHGRSVESGLCKWHMLGWPHVIGVVHSSHFLAIFALSPVFIFLPFFKNEHENELKNGPPHFTKMLYHQHHHSLVHINSMVPPLPPSLPQPSTATTTLSPPSVAFNLHSDAQCATSSTTIIATTPFLTPSGWKSYCIDWKKTGNQTGPNCSPVCVAAAKEVVVDQSSCQLHGSENIYKPNKDQLQPVF